MDGKPRLFSDTTRTVDVGRGPRKAEPWPASEPLSVKWFKVEPTADYVDNEAGGFHWAEIPYAETAWATVYAVILSQTRLRNRLGSPVAGSVCAAATPTVAWMMLS